VIALADNPHQSQRQSFRDIAKILGISAGYLSKIGERYKFPWHIDRRYTFRILRANSE